MPERKLRLVYDVSYFKFGYQNNSNRSGLFLVAYNIFKKLVARKDIDLILYADPFDSYIINNLLKKEFPNVKYRLNHTLISWFNYKARCYKHDRKLIKKTLFRLLTILFSFEKVAHKICRDTFEGSDAFLSPVFAIPKHVKTEKYNVIYDVIPLKFKEHGLGRWRRGFWLYDLFATLKNEDNYFCISQSTRKDILEFYPSLDPNKVHVTLLGCDERFVPCKNNLDDIKNKYNIPQDKKYIFSLCTLEPRKNLVRAVKTFVEFIKKHKIDDLVFVLGGGHLDKFLKVLESELLCLNEYRSVIVRAGYIDDADLPALYSGAEWFVFTSMYEGFGLPPLEAMSCGCPVITSNNSSLPEVVGDAGIMIDWDDDQQHVEAYEKYYFDEELRKEYREKGLMRSKQFSWSKCVDSMINVMKKNAGI